MTGVPAQLAVSILWGLVFGSVVTWLVRPLPRLARRVRPYTAASVPTLGDAADVLGLGVRRGGAHAVLQLFAPPVRSLADRLGRIIDHRSERQLALQLRQAGLLEEVALDERVAAYRLRQLGAGVGAAAAGSVVAVGLGRSAGVTLLVATACGVAGVTRWRARLDRALQQRRARMRVELYTVNQMLAMNVRTGGGVLHAMQRVVERGRGEIVAELADALRAHASGLRASETLERLARLTPEPSAARTYRVLAASAELGTDLAQGLRALSDDLRAERREAIRRDATRRRALMLIPIIGILAPTMLLFIAAPIPSLVFGLR